MDHFRCYVVRCAFELIETRVLLSTLLRSAEVSKAKVDQFHELFLFVEEHVLRLQVAVNDVQLVQVVERLKALPNDPSCLLFSEATTRLGV